MRIYRRKSMEKVIKTRGRGEDGHSMCDGEREGGAESPAEKKTG